MKIDPSRSMQAYNDMQQRIRIQRKVEDLTLEKKLTAQRLEEIELKRIRLNRELDQAGQNVDKYA